MNLKVPKPQGEEAAKTRWVHPLALGACLLLTFVAAEEAWTVGKLRNANALLQQRLADLEPLESRNLELGNENQRLKDFKQTAMEELERLKGEVQQLCTASNLQKATIDFANEQMRSKEQENLELEARVTGKPRVPRLGAWLGMNIADVQNGNGITVKSVVYRSPAARAEVQEGDVVEAVDGTLVQDADAFKAIMAQKTAGQITVLDLVRDNSPLRIELTTIDWPQ